MFEIALPNGAGTIEFPFTDQQLTANINRIPTRWGRVTGLGLFPERRLSSTLAQIVRQNGVLRVLPATERGGPASKMPERTRDALYVPVPHFPVEDCLRPQELQDAVEYDANGRQMSTVSAATYRKLEAMHSSFRVTWEYARMGALKGVVVDGAGSEQIDLYQAFEVDRHTVYLDLPNDAADVPKAISGIQEHIEDHLLGDVMTGVRVLVARDLWHGILGHPSVKFYFQGLGFAAPQISTGADQQSININGVIIEAYGAKVPLWSGTMQPLIEDGHGYAHPEGTQNCHMTHVAPANRMDAVNQPGQPIVISAEPLKHNLGVEFLGETNFLPIWTQPEALVTVRGAAPSAP
jgi:hypothetical protein